MHAMISSEECVVLMKIIIPSMKWKLDTGRVGLPLLIECRDGGKD